MHLQMVQELDTKVVPQVEVDEKKLAAHRK
jgi:hypothetical protein